MTALRNTVLKVSNLRLIVDTYLLSESSILTILFIFYKIPEELSIQALTDALQVGSADEREEEAGTSSPYNEEEDEMPGRQQEVGEVEQITVRDHMTL